MEAKWTVIELRLVGLRCQKFQDRDKTGQYCSCGFRFVNAKSIQIVHQSRKLVAKWFDAILLNYAW